jgi:predicted nucleic acid-binding protein
MADATIAGIAKTQDLMLVTLNTKHFLPFGIGVATPDEAVQLA